MLQISRRALDLRPGTSTRLLLLPAWPPDVALNVGAADGEAEADARAMRSLQASHGVLDDAFAHGKRDIPACPSRYTAPLLLVCGADVVRYPLCARGASRAAGSAVLRAMSEQRGRLQGAHRKALAALQRLGVSDRLLRRLEMRSQADTYLVYAGIFVTLVVVWYVWRWKAGFSSAAAAATAAASHGHAIGAAAHPHHAGPGSISSAAAAAGGRLGARSS